MLWAWPVFAARSKLLQVINFQILNFLLNLIAGGGYTPALVVQGKVAIVTGPLSPTDDRPPVFAQIFVLDPTEDPNSLEMQQRIRSLGMFLKMKSRISEEKLKILRVTL